MAEDIPSEPSHSPIPVAPSLDDPTVGRKAPRGGSVIDGGTVRITVYSLVLGLVGGLVAQALTALIGFITNIAFYGRLSTEFVSPAGNHLGIFVVIVPVAGALIVGIMARYGSQAIRGHGIPEAMEQVLTNRSRIQPRLTFLKPVSSAIAIGTGGPFGAEGPIIATGGAFGSLLGQLLHTTNDERKTLLAAGAAAGMAGTFGSPVAAVLLAVELLLFEFKARSLIPVAMASVAATVVRISFLGADPIFAMPHIAAPGAAAIGVYVALGALTGLAAVYVTRAVYGLEDLFARIPVHWMWWPAIGAVAVGVVGYFAPDTLGVGYNVIDDILSGGIAGKTLAVLFILKFVSWSIALSSGTSGGTLAPLFTIGGGLGAVLGAGAVILLPAAGIDPNTAALVGMAAMFTGASRAFLTSVVFAFETTLEPHGILPLLGGCGAAYLVSALMMRYSIMTEKIERRGIKVPAEYGIDALAGILVRECASYKVSSLETGRTLREIKSWLNSGLDGSGHQGYPVLDENGELKGMLTRKDVFSSSLPDTARLFELVTRRPVTIYEDDTLRDAMDVMSENDIGRLPVVIRSHPGRVVGILTRSDVMTANKKHLNEARRSEASIQWLAIR
ncbi:MAG TPA: chloride channel protein [Thermodesulfobacteriota bacterium]|nr:chloride channel protein [Thermodesulfobacteriota bacterium]